MVDIRGFIRVQLLQIQKSYNKESCLVTRKSNISPDDIPQTQGRDMMLVSGDIAVNVPGWDDMVQKYPARAATLMAFVRAELEIGRPTKYEVLDMMIQMGFDLSENSSTAVLRQIKHLVADNHIIEHESNANATHRVGMREKPVGALTRPWQSVYVRSGVKSPR